MDSDELRHKLESSLHFGTLAEAENSLRDIHSLFTECRKVDDRSGMSMCRNRILEGKRRSRQIARNPRVAQKKRAEKDEICTWFTLWLQSPDRFFVWLDMRKASDDFRHRFLSPAPDHTGAEPENDHLI